MASSSEIVVFIDTNLGTRIAMAVGPDITAGDFKKELEIRHFNCFPKLGEIKVYGLLVKQKSSFYHLPNSMPIKHVFLGLERTWFLRAEAKPLFELDGSGLSLHIDAKVKDHNLNGNDATDSLVTSTENNGIISNKKGRINGSHGTTPLSKELSGIVSLSKRKKKEKRVDSAVVCNSRTFAEIPSERASSNFSEMSKLSSTRGCNATSITIQDHLKKQLKAKTNGTCTSLEIDSLPELAVKTPPRIFSFPLSRNSRLETSRSNPGKTEVGKRLVKASKKISVSTHKTTPSVSFCRFKNGKLSHNRALSLAQYLAFEISDNDD